MADNQTSNQAQANINASTNPSNPAAGSPFWAQPATPGQASGASAAPGQPLTPGARQLNDLLDRFARPFLAKCLTRLITWGATAICGYLALAAPDQTWTTQAAATAAGAACLIAATTIDRWHHKADTSR
jgi:hypothetical protein